MLALHRSIPCGIDLFLMQRKPSDDNLQLPTRKRTGKKFAVHTDLSLIFAIVHVNMRLIVLLRVSEQHVNNDTGKAR